MDYTFYKAEDLMTDEYFIQWVKQPSEETNAFWNTWLSKNPEKEAMLQEARQVVMMLDFKTVKAPKGKSLEIWQKINQADNQRIMSVVAEPSIQRNKTSHVLYGLAAACLLVGIAAFIFKVIYADDSIVIQTEYAELRSIMLPDSTKVVLNANSELRYNKDFSTTRQVWLTGEGFFIVRHKTNNQNFRVFTDGVQVEVLGTKFNVNTRRGKSQVVLEEGKVKLNVAEDQSGSMVMKPGELVLLNNKTRKVERKQVDVDTYSAWRSNRLVFVGTRLDEIAQVLEDNYGYEVVFESEAAKENEFTGSASVDNLDELLGKMERVFNLKMSRDGKKLTIKNK